MTSFACGRTRLAKPTSMPGAKDTERLQPGFLYTSWLGLLSIPMSIQGANFSTLLVVQAILLFEMLGLLKDDSEGEQQKA